MNWVLKFIKVQEFAICAALLVHKLSTDAFVTVPFDAKLHYKWRTSFMLLCLCIVNLDFLNVLSCYRHIINITARVLLCSVSFDLYFIFLKKIFPNRIEILLPSMFAQDNLWSRYQIMWKFIKAVSLWGQCVYLHGQHVYIFEEDIWTAFHMHNIYCITVFLDCVEYCMVSCLNLSLIPADMLKFTKKRLLSWKNEFLLYGHWCVWTDTVFTLTQQAKFIVSTHATVWYQVNVVTVGELLYVTSDSLLLYCHWVE